MELPHDIASCHELILHQAGQIAVLTAKNSELAGQVSALMDQFRSLSVQNTELLRQNTELATQVGVLHKRLEEQESRLHPNSRNSHRPPSSDGPAKRPALPHRTFGRLPPASGANRGTHTHLALSPFSGKKTLIGT